MAAYNAGPFIKTAIDSILNQSFPDLELIVVDDASTDDTEKVVQAYMITDNRITLISNKQNQGAIISRNKALQVAEGKYIAIQDADDVSELKRLQIQYAFLEAHPDIALVGANALHIDEAGNVVGKTKLPSSVSTVAETLPHQNCIYHSAVLFRNERMLYRDKMRFCEDYDFYLQLLAHGKSLINLPQYLVQYRIVSNSESRSNSVMQHLFSEKARQLFVAERDKKKDAYEAFDPRTLLSLDLDNPKSLERSTLAYVIRKHYHEHRYQRGITDSKVFFRRFGYFDKVALYYMACKIKSVLVATGDETIR
jgi:glycosyltransferase involved in cell wall biosynthesis